MTVEKENGKITLTEMGIPVLKGNEIKNEFGALFSKYIGKCYIDIEDCTINENSIRERIKKGLYSNEMAKSHFNMHISLLEGFRSLASCEVKYYGYYNLRTQRDSNNSKLTVIFNLPSDVSENSPIVMAIMNLASVLKNKYETHYIEG